MRDTVLDRLEQAEQDDLAVILKFLLQTVSPSTIDMVCRDIIDSVMTTNHLDRSFMVLDKSSISGLLEEHRVLDNAMKMMLKD